MKACPGVAATGFNQGLQVRVALMAARPAGQHHAHVAGSPVSGMGLRSASVAMQTASLLRPSSAALAGGVAPPWSAERNTLSWRGLT